MEYKNTVEALNEFSNNAKIFVLIHKMDRIPEKDKEHVFNMKKNEIKKLSEGMIVTEIFQTTIW